ncbi:peptidoglycan editing factor PgeF [Pseudoxanthomonas putridarboris]|uniref:Purine nucleoside phosphorylase n=1 Tax=Pseudoxanthomonas putridarboris TaxID=752605 RepID=A0ABU9J400_9GAMM
MSEAAIRADWPAPPGVHAFTTLRYGAGMSQPPFDSFNLGNCRSAEGDDPAVVGRNRAELAPRFALPSSPHWLRQVHGTDVVRFDGPPAVEGDEPEADASATSVAGVVLAILTADCLPVVFAAKDGSEVGAAHAGWPGLSKGMLEATVAAMRTPPAQMVAWIGPAAGPQRYEVGADVFDVFVSQDAGAASAFRPTRPGHWLADLPALARRRLTACGLSPADIHGGDLCTIGDPARFFSHRRDGRTGRMATVVWRQP